MTAQVTFIFDHWLCSLQTTLVIESNTSPEREIIEQVRRHSSSASFQLNVQKHLTSFLEVWAHTMSGVPFITCHIRAVHVQPVRQNKSIWWLHYSKTFHSSYQTWDNDRKTRHQLVTWKKNEPTVEILSFNILFTFHYKQLFTKGSKQENLQHKQSCRSEHAGQRQNI